MTSFQLNSFHRSILENKAFFLLLSAAALFSVCGTALSAELEHPLITPIPDSVLLNDLSYYRELDAFQFPVPTGSGESEFRMVQGRKWFLAYMSPKKGSGGEPYTRFEILENYKALNRQHGGRVLYEDEGRLYFSVTGPEQITYWVYVWSSDLGFYNLHIVEEAPRAGKGATAQGEAAGKEASPINPVLAELRTLLRQAEDAYVAGEKFAAMDTLKEAISTVGRELPLTARNMRLVEDTIHYQTRKNNIYNAGDPILISCQLTGYGFKRDGENYTIDIVTDFLVLAEDGKVLGSQEGAFYFSHTSPGPTPEFPMDLSYVLSDAPRGIYTIHTVIKDKNSSKQTKFINEIVIR